MGKRPTGKCPLCGEIKLLCDSHYLPQKLYTLGRAKALSNPNPVMPVRGELKQISDQYRGYVFCDDCEDLFNKNGEKWVLANIPHDYDDPMPLEKAVAGLVPVATGKDVVLLDASGVSACHMAKLVYFGISIFWRGSAYDWKSTAGERLPKVELCAYAEPLRQFLLGKAALPATWCLRSIFGLTGGRFKFRTRRCHHTCPNARDIGFTSPDSSSYSTLVAGFRAIYG